MRKMRDLKSAIVDGISREAHYETTFGMGSTGGTVAGTVCSSSLRAGHGLGQGRVSRREWSADYAGYGRMAQPRHGPEIYAEAQQERRVFFAGHCPGQVQGDAAWAGWQGTVSLRRHPGRIG